MPLSSEETMPAAEPAVQMRITDLQLQAYLQRYPFATGPDAALNKCGRKALATSLAMRPAGRAVEPALLSEEEASLDAVDKQAAEKLFDAIQMAPAMQAKHLNDFGWKVKGIGRDAKNVLVIGCGDGVELMFLRAVLPTARLTAIDYYDGLLPGLEDAVGVTKLTGDMNQLLRGLSREYDLVFSNHTLEHLYTPDEMLAVLASLTLAGGEFVSALPVCGREGAPFLDRIRVTAESNSTERKVVPSLDTVFYDAGHPWKTNPSDLAATLERAGFDDVKIFQRRDHLCRPLRAGRAELERRRITDHRKHSAILGTLRLLTKILFLGYVPTFVAKWFFALERRLPFGTNGMMNTLCEEVLFLCRRSGA